MGLFSSLFGKKKEEEKKDDGSFEFITDFRKHLIDDILVVPLPVAWIPFESDRFRASTEDGQLQMSLINYENKNLNDVSINENYFKDLKLALYDRFVTEGEYEPYDDLRVTDSYITKSFKVDEETQYYFTTARKIDGRMITTDIIVREIGDYNREMPPLLITIGSMIRGK